MLDESPEPLNSPEEPGVAGIEPSAAPQSNGHSWIEPQMDSGQEAPTYLPQPLMQQEIYGIPQLVPERPKKPRRIPNLGDTLLFFVMALVLIGIGQLIGVFALHLMRPHVNTAFLLRFSATDARASIPIQAFAYGLIALISVPVFTVMWNRPLGEGVHWNNAAATARFFRLAILGLAIGGAVSVIGNFLPMPKNPPITQDMMKSTAGAWMMLVFGLTAAPLLEELAFRGFLLPGLINFFRWIGGGMTISERAVDRAGVPIAIALTSLAFAFMHSPQVSQAWGPLLLIGLVSIVLCVVRLLMNSVAAGVIVHALYNFTLFAAVLYQTDGFRHLNKLT
ncbi:MAG TPA: CPBP family intramembrane glutamic endopeptidase [Acidobacteriaceae bacterium]|nr:CPBP family intramembrane glutamic endopeptidase [Acidobacteriaceae bacterium]